MEGEDVFGAKIRVDFATPPSSPSPNRQQGGSPGSRAGREASPLTKEGTNGAGDGYSRRNRAPERRVKVNRCRFQNCPFSKIPYYVF